MLRDGLIQFGTILLPIFAYQFWTVRKAFDSLPLRVITFAMYGLGAALIAQLTPIRIFGVAESFPCIPIILSILYGKRKVGLIVMCGVAAFDIVTMGKIGLASAFAMFIYCTIPMLICHIYEQYTRSLRMVTCLLLSLITLLIQVAEIYLLFVLFAPQRAQFFFGNYGHFLIAAAGVQFVTMGLATLSLENILEDGRIRLHLEQSRHALALSEERYRSLVDYNGSGICALDLDGRIVMANSAYQQMTGYTLEELSDKHRSDLWFAEDWATAKSLMEHALGGHVTKDAEFRLRHKTGRAIYVNVSHVPMIVAGRVEGVYGVVTDITDQRNVAELVKRQEKLTTVGQLAAGVAHEIRNPLTAIQGFLKLLSHDLDTHQDYLQIMADELARIELISGELLVLAKPSLERYRHVDIHRLIVDVGTLMKAQALMSNVDIVWRIPTDPLYIWCEEGQIKQVFINVIRNAIDAMGTGGRVDIYTENTGHSVQIVIADKGTGMSEETLARLGEPFFTTKSTGTGLGLMVTHQILERYHGKIDYSSHIGIGTTVTITFRADKMNKALSEAAVSLENTESG